jgi:hypothetical protein
LTSIDLGAALAKEQDYYCLGVFGHCYGAEMFHQLLNNTAAGKGVGVAASKAASHALPPEGTYDAFLYNFTAALATETPSKYSVSADAKKDGHIDVWEAYDFACAMNVAQSVTDTPDLQDNSARALALANKLTLTGLLP